MQAAGGWPEGTSLPSKGPPARGHGLVHQKSVMSGQTSLQEMGLTKWAGRRNQNRSLPEVVGSLHTEHGRDHTRILGM